MSDTVDPEAILNCLIDGASIAEAARRFSVPESEIRAVVDEEAARYYDPATMRQRWMLAERRMLSLELQFYRLAKAKDDHVAGALAVEANERRATLQRRKRPDRSCGSTDEHCAAGSGELDRILHQDVGSTGRQAALGRRPSARRARRAWQ